MAGGSSRLLVFLQLFPIVVGVSLWGEQLTCGKVVFWSDNQGVVSVIIKKQAVVFLCSYHGTCFIIVILCRIYLKWNSNFGFGLSTFLG